jgi:hypothetical protein
MKRPTMKSLSKKISFSALLLLLSSCGGGSSGDSPQSASTSVSLPSLSQIPIELNSGMTLGEARWSSGNQNLVGAIDSVECLKNENYHIHAHLSIFLNGVRQMVPKNIGLGGCALEIHTHDESGIIHIETDSFKQFTLGQLFSVWGLPLRKDNVAGITGLPFEIIIVDGVNVTKANANISSIELLPHRSINIVIGSVPSTIPTYRWPSDL